MEVTANFRCCSWRDFFFLRRSIGGLSAEFRFQRSGYPEGRARPSDQATAHHMRVSVEDVTLSGKMQLLNE